jgi:hypothetical protein
MVSHTRLLCIAMRGDVNCEGFGDDLWKLGLLRYSTRGATVPVGTFHVEKAERGQLGLAGCRERRPRGFAHGRQERRVFLPISSLIRLMHHLSLNREDYLTPKQGLDLIPKPNPNGPTEPAHWTRPISPLTHDNGSRFLSLTFKSRISISTP